MERKLFTLVLFGMLVLVGCAPAAAEPEATPTEEQAVETEPAAVEEPPAATDEPQAPDEPAEDPDSPVSSGQGSGGEEGTGDQPADDLEMTEGVAYPESISVLLLESFPLQASAVVTGTVADGCTSVQGASATRDGNVFNITVDAVRPAGDDLVCTMALEPFEVSVPLDIQGLPAGEYTVIAASATTTFTLDVDNVLPQ